MSTKTLALCAAMGIAAIAAPMFASARTYVDVDIAPPASRVEVIPSARAGYVWSPGYYNYSGHKHVWVGGQYRHERHGYHWTADRWDQHDTHWRHEPGRWDRD